jgi:hypothetical protein
MSKWISGNELIENLGLKDFEFFNNCVAKGLQPHNDFGKPIPPSELFQFAKTVMEKVGADLEIEQVDEGRVDWEGISLPKHDINARTILGRLCYANYKREDVEKFELKPESKAAKKSSDKQEKKKEHYTAAEKRQVQETAKILYAQHPEYDTVKVVAEHPEIKKLVGRQYKPNTTYKWVSEVAPEKAKKPGVRSKNKK